MFLDGVTSLSKFLKQAFTGDHIEDDWDSSQVMNKKFKVYFFFLFSSQNWESPNICLLMVPIHTAHQKNKNFSSNAGQE